MRSRQPKRNIIPIKFKDALTGDDRRMSYAETILYKEKRFPKPLGYEDIDSEFGKFIDSALEMVDSDGKRIPTFTLYSTQRFSEYSQTWEHTDEQGNLLMNFKTVNRENNPSRGTNQGNYWNIPGDRYYTLLREDVLDDNGNENVVLYSMKQPFTVDMNYRVNFITNTFSMLNVFNSKINDLFKARQCYIRPNGHYIPMVIDSIDDETSYTIEDRKFFVQSVHIKIMAYIINPEDFKVSKYSKQPRLYALGERQNKRPVVNIEEYEETVDHRHIDIVVNFKEYDKKVIFEMDTDVDVECIQTENVRNLRLFINDVPYYTDGSFKLRKGDIVRLKIRVIDEQKPSKVIFKGIDPMIKIDTSDYGGDGLDDQWVGDIELSVE